MRTAILVVPVALLSVSALAIAGAPMAVAGIDLYQRTLSPIMSRLVGPCRFTPSCSHYAQAVITRDGLLVGGLRAAGRVVRCGPWTPAGSVDPP